VCVCVCVCVCADGRVCVCVCVDKGVWIRTSYYTALCRMQCCSTVVVLCCVVLCCVCSGVGIRSVSVQALQGGVCVAVS